jgi:hypothetical protein
MRRPLPGHDVASKFCELVFRLLIGGGDTGVDGGLHEGSLERIEGEYKRLTCAVE